MSFTPKDLTTGGQMMSYNLRMFGQVNTWIGAWVFLLFLFMTAVLTWAVTPYDVLRNGFWYWCASLNAGFLPLMNGSSSATWDVVWTCGDKVCSVPLTLAQIVSDRWMIMTGDTLARNLRLSAAGSALFCMLLFAVVVFAVGRAGKKNRSDEFLSGMTLTDKPAEVNRLLKKKGVRSDLRIGDLSMVKRAEVMNFLMHGTVGVGKSTMIRWLLDYIRKRGDRAIIYDSGCTFVETHYDPRRDVIMNPHDARCPNWDLWRECREVVDYENLTASLIPVEGESDPFWVSSSRTIFGDGAMKMASDPERSIEKFLKLLLSMGLKDLREYLRNMPSANLVEEKIEKTAISIRSVVTNYAKSLRYLQGLDRDGRPGFSIREWMTDERYDSSWMFISTTARHRKAVRPLISMWLSLATIYLQSMGENSDRRVWFLLDEISSLQKIPELNSTLAEARKFGGCFVIGIQNMAQLTDIYGQYAARSILDLLNTRAYGRSPSAEVAKMVQDELGSQRRREAREQNSFGLDQVRDGISISHDKVQEPVVDYEKVMSLDNLNFYVRLPGDYPVVKLALKYRDQKKVSAGLAERNFDDALSPVLEQIIRNNETGNPLTFPEAEEARSAPVPTVKAAAKPAPATTAPASDGSPPLSGDLSAPAPDASPAPVATRGAAVLRLVKGGRPVAAAPAKSAPAVTAPAAEPATTPASPAVTSAAAPIAAPAEPEPAVIAPAAEPATTPASPVVTPAAAPGAAPAKPEPALTAPAAEPATTPASPVITPAAAPVAAPAKPEPALTAPAAEPATPSASPAVTSAAVPAAIPVKPDAAMTAPAARPPFLPASARALPAAPTGGRPAALGYLRRRPATDAQDGDAAPEGGGEAPELNMEAEQDERGELVLRTAGVHRASPDEPEGQARDDVRRANRAMAEEEKNILRHKDDYDAYSNMQHDEGFER